MYLVILLVCRVRVRSLFSFYDVVVFGAITDCPRDLTRMPLLSSSSHIFILYICVYIDSS